MPCRDRAPYVGLSPTKPQNAAGSRTEPQVSVPKATRAISPATAAAEPPEEPPGTKDGSSGVLVAPKALVWVVERMADSFMLVRPMTIAPAFFKHFITVASYVAL